MQRAQCTSSKPVPRTLCNKPFDLKVKLQVRLSLL
ncbi:hypothetical protein VARIO8X_110133 [Burkholderiales bacterium 8X]|nr:hypothetical protein VARIO8X_110133 [Burkholderiales bacterium 8X]